MSIELIGFNEICDLKAAMWCQCLNLAKTYGWIPAGTLHPLEDLSSAWLSSAHERKRQCPWGGGYTTNDRQRVTDTDAYTLAMALHRAIADCERSPGHVDHRYLDALKRVADFVSKGRFAIG